MSEKSRQRRVAILIFDEVEVLDFCGPFEVFSVTGVMNPPQPFQVYTVAEILQSVIARNGLSVNPRYHLSDCPAPDILLIPGGLGTRREMHNQGLIAWIRNQAVNAELVLSVCTGALLLAKARLLDGLGATTHHGAIDLLREVAPPGSGQPEKTVYRQREGDRRRRDLGRNRHVPLCSIKKQLTTRTIYLTSNVRT